MSEDNAALLQSYEEQNILEIPNLTSESSHRNTINKEQAGSDEEDESSEAKYVKLDNHTKIVASHYNSVKEKGLYERSKSRIFYMRNFNNWIKSVLIAEYIGKIRDSLKLGEPLRVLDMCCGKGGDLFKWEKAKITHLIGTDIAELSIEQCKDRYNMIKSQNTQKFSAEFFACDATLNRFRERYRDPSIKLNLVSCQFAFHYCFETLKQAECMLQNAAECLLPGGYFIGTIPDAYEIIRRQKLSECDTFGNDIYKLTFQCDTSDLPLFGAKYDFYLEGVVNCPEFLVHFPTFVKLARKFGLELERKEMFYDYYELKIQTPEGRQLIQKMNAVEAYSPNYKNLSGDHTDYNHAFNYCNRRDTTKTIGTLSKSEWEAITLYSIFVFRKVKTTWNKEGKPEYDFSK